MKTIYYVNEQKRQLFIEYQEHLRLSQYSISNLYKLHC